MSRRERKPKAGSSLDIDKYDKYLQTIITLLKNELSKEHELSEKHEFFSESELLNELEVYIIDASTEGVTYRSGGKTPLPNSLILFKFPSILYVARIEFKPSHSKIRQELANTNFNLVDEKMISSRIWNTTINEDIKNHIHNKGQWDTVTDLSNRKLYSMVKEYNDKHSIKCVFVDTTILRSDFGGNINLELSDVSNFIVATIKENLDELPSLSEISVAAPSLLEDPPLTLDPTYDIYKEEEPLTMEEIQELLKKSEKKSDSGVKRRSTKRKRSISRRRSAKRKRSMTRRRSVSKRIYASRRSGSKRRSRIKRL